MIYDGLEQEQIDRVKACLKGMGKLFDGIGPEFAENPAHICESSFHIIQKYYANALILTAGLNAEYLLSLGSLMVGCTSAINAWKSQPTSNIWCGLHYMISDIRAGRNLAVAARDGRSLCNSFFITQFAVTQVTSLAWYIAFQHSPEKVPMEYDDPCLQSVGGYEIAVGPYPTALVEAVRTLDAMNMLPKRVPLKRAAGSSNCDCAICRALKELGSNDIPHK